MADIEHLRLGFCSLIMQAKGSLISNFVAWLDLKVAEYKVYGHMILNDDNESENTGAWQYSSPSDPSNWPRSLPDNFGDQASSGLPQMSSDNTMVSFSAPMPASTRGRKMPYSRPSFRGRPRPARPKSVTNLLKNAISRTTKAGGGQSQFPTAQVQTSTVNTSSEFAQPTSNSQSIAQMTHAETMPTDSGADSVTAVVKTEPGLQMSVEAGEQFNQSADDQSMWLSESAAGSSSAIDQSPSTSYTMPVVSQRTPSSRGRGRGRGGMMSSPVVSTGASSGAMMASPASKRTPSRDSVNELLQTHTIQTESGLICGICEKVFHSFHRTTVHRHIRAVHLCQTWKCPFCADSFKWHSQYKRHLQSVHQIIQSSLIRKRNSVLN